MLDLAVDFVVVVVAAAAITGAERLTTNAQSTSIGRSKRSVFMAIKHKYNNTGLANKAAESVQQRIEISLSGGPSHCEAQ